MSVKLLTEHHLELLSLKGGCIGSCESTLVEMPRCWESHALAHIYMAETSKESPMAKPLNQSKKQGGKDQESIQLNEITSEVQQGTVLPLSNIVIDLHVHQ